MIEGTKTSLPAVLPTIHVHPIYSLEREDSQHRDGRALQKCKSKFDHMIHKNPKSDWKGKFWTWLDSELKHHPLPPTRYLNETERKDYSPEIRHGRLYKKKGTAISNEVMFVIDTEKKLYVKRKKDAETPRKFSYNHASFLSGAPVVSAGKITLNHEGKIVLLKNASGHYQPGKKEMVVALKVFQEKGIPVKNIQVSMRNSKIPTMNGKAFLKKFENKLAA